MILPNFEKNCMKLRKFWAVGGWANARGRPPSNPPLSMLQKNSLKQMSVCFFIDIEPVVCVKKKLTSHYVNRPFFSRH